MNDDTLPDIVFGVQLRDINDNSIVQTKLLQMLGGPLPIITEVATDECNAISNLVAKDLDQDGFTDVVGHTTDYERQNLNNSKICIFKGTETGLVLDNEHVANDTSLDLNNAGVRAAGLIDRNNDVTLDLYLLGENKEYWIEVGATDGPKFEEFDYDNTILTDQTITAITAFDFDSDANEDIVMSVNDNNGSGRFITVPKSGDGTNWAEAQAYENMFNLCKVDGHMWISQSLYGGNGFYNFDPSFFEGMAAANNLGVIYSAFVVNIEPYKQFFMPCDKEMLKGINLNKVINFLIILFSNQNE